MGPSPPSSTQLPQSRQLLSAADDWFLHASDRDTQILTQALTHQLSSSTASPSLFPSPASCSSSSSLHETFSHRLEGRSLQSQSFEALMSLQQQQQQQQRQHHQQQQQLNHLQQQQKSAAMSSMRYRADGFSHVEQNSLQKGSPLSSNSSPPLSASTEAPASPFSTLSTNSAISTIAPQHHDSQDGRFALTMAPSLKPPEVSSVYSDSSLSSKALSSQASVGAGGSKVSKRRNRASCKAPIAVLSADTSNFRALVQQLTGIPSSSSLHSYTNSGMPLLKPQPTRHQFTSTFNLPTLDTSACFFGLKNMNSFEQRPHQLSSNSAAANLNPFSGVDLSRIQGHNVENTTLRSHMPPHFNDQSNSINHSLSSSLPSLPKLWDSADSFKTRGNFSSLHEGEQIFARQNPIQTPATLDSLLMEEHLAPKSSFNAVDSWLSFDGANHAPNIELARMA